MCVAKKREGIEAVLRVKGEQKIQETWKNQKEQGEERAEEIKKGDRDYI